MKPQGLETLETPDVKPYELGNCGDFIAITPCRRRCCCLMMAGPSEFWRGSALRQRQLHHLRAEPHHLGPPPQSWTD
jgi:hypothetical protein